MKSLKPPKLAPFLDARRRALDITLDELAKSTSTSYSYITKLLNGERERPTDTMMAAVADALHLTPDERLHVRHLIRADLDPPTLDLYQESIDPSMLARLQNIEPYLGAVLDERWTVWASNDAYDRAYPELAEYQNVLAWFFRSPSARIVMLEWRAEALLTVGWFRGLMGKYGSPAWAMEILDDLNSEPEFVDMWELQTVNFGRHQPTMHLRDAETGTPWSVDVQITLQPDRPNPLQFFQGIPLPFQGPAELLSNKVEDD